MATAKQKKAKAQRIRLNQKASTRRNKMNSAPAKTGGGGAGGASK